MMLLTVQIKFFLSTEFSALSLEEEVYGLFILHAVQLSPLSSFKEHEFLQYIPLSSLSEKTYSFAVKVQAVELFKQ